MACPLCGCERAGASWLGTTYYHDREFPYDACLECGTLYCAPMPDATLLAEMYGTGYTQDGESEGQIEDPKEPQRVLDLLRSLPAGTFVDYGCGNGELLLAAQNEGWKAIGVEFNVEVSRAVSKRTGAQVFTVPLQPDFPAADVLHLGDVIEHLTRLDEQMPEILRLIKPGGLLLAQGPLEANASLFTSVLAMTRRLRNGHRTEMAPYHVLLATASGQREFFRRFGLAEIGFTLREVAWPAPAGLSLSNLQPRTVGLFALRRISQAISSLAPHRLGNRYFYVGRRNALTPVETLD